MKLSKNMKYSFCTCGLSETLPICDNSHREYNLINNTNYKSLKIIPDSDVNVEVKSSTWKS
mgnify:FL=1|jgi:CDGSH-type Zn-finger protein|tara:strand:- start:1583 stop:1765 length:183 start_codon:yes stop_codon:yes gene_type:complete